MTSTLEKKQSPAWFEALRKEAWEKYESAEWPDRKEENWRFGSVKESEFDGLELASGGTGEAPAQIEGSLRFIFQNNELIESPSDLPEGLMAMPFAEALAQHGDCMEKVMPPLQGKLGSPKLAALHRARCESGVAIYATQKIEPVIEIVHLISGEGQLTLPYLHLAAGEGGSVRVAERFISVNDDATNVVSVCDVITEEGSEVTYLATQELNEKSRFVRFADSRVEKEAVGRVAVVHTGSSWMREENYSTVDGEDGKSEILSVAVPTTGQEYDQRTFQHHGARGTFSDLLFKNTLFGKAKTIFSGLIFVDEGAHDTDAYQTCRNLLMSDDCEANSMPGLEINADQVKCSHGSTSAQVSEEEIFYLQARGIPANKARRLIAKGFSFEAIQKLNCEALEMLAVEVVDEKFARVD